MENITTQADADATHRDAKETMEQQQARVTAVIEATRGLSASEAVSLFDEAREAILRTIPVDIEKAVTMSRHLNFLN